MFKKLKISFRLTVAAIAALVLLAPNLASAQSLTIQGRVQSSSGAPLIGANTEFRVKILTPNSNRCVLFDETYVVDLSQSSGLFSINLGTGIRTTNPSGNYSLDDAISNGKGLPVNAIYCDPSAGGSGTISYSPNPTDNRKMIIQFKDASAGMTTFDTIPEMDMNPVAYAMEARTTGGYPASSILRVANSGTPGVAPILTDAYVTELQALLGGTSGNYMSTTSGSTTGARLPTVSGNPSTPSAGSIWFDTSGSGAIKYYDSSGVIQTLGTGTGSGTITGVTAGSGLSGGGTSGSVTLSLGSSGVAPSTYGSGGSVPVIQVDAFGRITSASSTPITGTLPSGTNGQFLRSNGTAWSSQKILLSDLKSSIGSNDLFSAPGCSASQALSWDSVTDQIKCQNISVPGSAITGTIAAAQLPAFTGGDVTAAAGSTALTLPNVVAASTYKSVTVDAKGRVTAGTNPTTLAGYGITDSLVANGGGVPTLKAGLYSALPAFGNVGNLFISTDTLTLYRDNGTGWDIVGAAGAGSSLSGVTAGTGLTGGGTSGNVTLNLSNVGTAGTYFKVGTDAQGRVTSGASALVAADIPNLDWAKIASGKPTTLTGYGITDSLVANAGGAISFSSGLASARPSSGFTAGRFYVSTDTKAIAYDNGTAWVDIVNASGGTNFSGNLSGDVTGTQGATVVSLVNGQTAATVAAGAVLANAATNLATNDAIVKRDGAGGFAAGAVSQSTAVFRDSASNTVGLAAPSTVTTSYSLTLPPAKATVAGQVLSSDTSGVLSWSTPVAATSVSVTAPVTNSGTATAPNIGMPAATASVDGFLSAANFTVFTNKLSSALTSAYLFVGNAGGTATGVALSGDATLSNTGALIVTGIRGKSVTAAPSAAGQILRYNGTAFDPTFISIRDMRSSLTGVNTLGATCTASQTLTWDSVGDVLTCSNIAINASAITAGILPIANGGTGANSVAQNLIFASPVGSTGAPAFRALAASDLPASASFWQAGTPGINYGGGNVGIGTTMPRANLDLGDLSPSISMGTNSALMGNVYFSGGWKYRADGYGGYFKFNDATTNAGSLEIGMTPAYNSSGAAAAAAPVPVLSILPSGKVGIGTTLPVATLDIAGSSAPVLRVLRSSTSTNGLTTTMRLSAVSSGTAADGFGPAQTFTIAGNGLSESQIATVGAARDGADNSGVIKFSPFLNGIETERMRIGSNGNVGIGATSPLEALHILGNLSAYNGGNVADAGGSLNFGVSDKPTYSAMATIKGVLSFIPGSSTEQQGGIAFSTRPLGPAGQIMAERMRITHAGNVGIGTVTPTSALQVNGIVTALGFNGPVTSSSTGTAAGYTINSDSDSAGSDGGVNIQVRGATKLAVTDGGNVAVGGETAPISLLANTSSNPLDSASTGVAATGITWLANAAGYVQSLTNSSSAGTANGLFVKTAGIAASNRLLTLNAAGTDVMTVTGQGRLGIGTTAPNSTFQVVGTGLIGSAAANGTNVSLNGGGPASTRSLSIYYNSGGTNGSLTGDYSVIQSGYGGVGYSPLALNSAGGNVAIGTTSAAYGLQVNNASGSGVNLGAAEFTNGSTDTGVRIVNTSAGGRAWTIHSSGTGSSIGVGNFNIWDSAAGASRFSINSSGNVGVGTTAPNTTLDVNGIITGRNNATFGYISGTSGGVQLSKTSWFGKPGIQSIDSANAAETLLINPNGGNVGIGTTNPAVMLDVAGDARFQRTGGSRLTIQTPASDARIYALDNAGVAQMLLLNPGGGNIGIGTTAPAVKLDVRGGGFNLGTNSSTSSSFEIDPSTTQQGTFRFTTDATANYIQSALATTGGSAKDLRFGPYGSTSTWLNIASSGMVGIGTTIYREQFDIKGGHVFHTGGALVHAFNGYYDGSGTPTWRANGYGGTAYVGGLAFDPVNGNMTLATSSTSAAQGGGVGLPDRLLIDKNGNIGVNTGAPNARLAVVGSGLFGTNGNGHVGGPDKVQVAGGANAAAMLAATSNGIRTFSMTAGGSGGLNSFGTDNGDFSFRTGSNWSVADPSTSGTELVRISAAGNVGIGLVPTYQLQLSTDSAAKPGTSTWTIASDERLKDIRAPFARGLEDLLKLNTIYFRYKANNPLDLPSDKEYVGIRAQDAEKAIPESVSRDEKGYLHVTNDAIIWTIVNSVKEIYGRITSSDSRIASLEAENKALQAQTRELASIVKKLQAESDKAAARLEKVERSGKPTAKH